MRLEILIRTAYFKRKGYLSILVPISATSIEITGNLDVKVVTR